MILLHAANFLDILKPILRLDFWLFHKINQVWINPFFDVVLPFIRQQEFWYFFYLFLLVFSILNFRVKGCWWSATLIMTVIIGDLVSSSFIKSFIWRLRP